jgi:predicted metal-dependent hydrolase
MGYGYDRGKCPFYIDDYGNVFFNVELAKKPLKCVEYVVAHELAHLIERTHNADFKKILDRHFPDWREIKDNLNRFPV